MAGKKKAPATVRGPATFAELAERADGAIDHGDWVGLCEALDRFNAPAILELHLSGRSGELWARARREGQTLAMTLMAAGVRNADRASSDALFAAAADGYESANAADRPAWTEQLRTAIGSLDSLADELEASLGAGWLLTRPRVARLAALSYRHVPMERRFLDLVEPMELAMRAVAVDDPKVLRAPWGWLVERRLQAAAARAARKKRSASGPDYAERDPERVLMMALRCQSLRCLDALLDVAPLEGDGESRTGAMLAIVESFEEMLAAGGAEPSAGVQASVARAWLRALRTTGLDQEGLRSWREMWEPPSTPLAPALLQGFDARLSELDAEEIASATRQADSGRGPRGDLGVGRATKQRKAGK